MPTTQRCGVISGVFALVVALSAQAKVDPAAVVGMWLFDEGGGKTAIDSSENGLDGAVVGPADWEKGMFGQAMHFDGASVAVEVTEDPSLVLPELTIVAWANIVSSAGVRWQSIMRATVNRCVNSSGGFLPVLLVALSDAVDVSDPICDLRE